MHNRTGEDNADAHLKRQQIMGRVQELAFQAGGDTDQAMSALQRTLTLAEPEGFIRIFVDEGPPMARLLYEAVARGIAPGYARRLLAAFPIGEPDSALGTYSSTQPPE